MAQHIYIFLISLFLLHAPCNAIRNNENFAAQTKKTKLIEIHLPNTKSPGSVLIKSNKIKTALDIALFAILGKSCNTNELNKLTNKDKEFLKQGLIAWDNDETISIPQSGYLGSGPCFAYYINQYEKFKERREEEAKEKIAYAIKLTSELLPYIPVDPVEETTIPLINNLQDAEIPMIGLTARDPIMTNGTLQSQLKRLNLDFTKTSPFKYKNEDHIASFFPVFNLGYYTDGWLFLKAQQNKGEALKRIITLYETFKGKLPTYIIFVDDLEKNVKDVQHAMQEIGIFCVGIVYTATQPYVEAFDARKLRHELFRRAGKIAKQLDKMENPSDGSSSDESLHMNLKTKEECEKLLKMLDLMSVALLPPTDSPLVSHPSSPHKQKRLKEF